MADILIRGMEMPKDGCRDCIFVNRKWRGDVCPILKREVTGNVERGGFQTDCPLLPLPAGHGKIIDGDALWENMTAEQIVAFEKGLAGTIELFEMLEAASPIVPAEGGTNDGN